MADLTPETDVRDLIAKPGTPAEPRELVGRLVRQIWVEWAREQPHPKPSWLLPWAELDDGQREVDMRIGAALFDAGKASALAAAGKVVVDAKDVAFAAAALAVVAPKGSNKTADAVVERFSAAIERRRLAATSEPYWMTKEADGSQRRAENRNDAEERVALGLASERWAQVYEPITVLAFDADGAPMRWYWRGRTRTVHRVLSHEPGVWRVHSTGGDVTVSITAAGFAVTQVRSVAATTEETGGDDS